MVDSERKFFEIYRTDNPFLPFWERRHKTRVERGSMVTLSVHLSDTGFLNTEVTIPQSGYVAQVKIWDLDRKGFDEYQWDLRGGSVGYRGFGNSQGTTNEHYVRLEKRIPYMLRQTVGSLFRKRIGR